MAILAQLRGYIARPMKQCLGPSFHGKQVRTVIPDSQDRKLLNYSEGADKLGEPSPYEPTQDEVLVVYATLFSWFHQ